MIARIMSGGGGFSSQPPPAGAAATGLFAPGAFSGTALAIATADLANMPVGDMVARIIVRLLGREGGAILPAPIGLLTVHLCVAVTCQAASERPGWRPYAPLKPTMISMVQSTVQATNLTM